MQMAHLYQAAGLDHQAEQHYSMAFEASTSEAAGCLGNVRPRSSWHVGVADDPLLQLERPPEGLARTPTPELLWIAGHAAYQVGDMRRAVAWA